MEINPPKTARDSPCGRVMNKKVHNKRSHTELSYSVTCICQSAAALTVWPPECSAEELDNNNNRKTRTRKKERERERERESEREGGREGGRG